MNAEQFAVRVQHLLPGSSGLDELADTIKMLRDAPAPAAVLIDLRYWRARCNELDEKLIGLSRRGEVCQPFRPSPDAPEDVPHWRKPLVESPALPTLDPAGGSMKGGTYYRLIVGSDYYIGGLGYKVIAPATVIWPAGRRPTFHPLSSVEGIPAAPGGGPLAAAKVPRPTDELSPRQRFRAARGLLGLSQAAMAARIGAGWTAAMVSQVETARRPCPAEVLAAVERMAVGS